MYDEHGNLTWKAELDIVDEETTFTASG